MGRWGNVAKGLTDTTTRGQNQLIQTMLADRLNQVRNEEYERRQKRSADAQKSRDVRLRNERIEEIDYKSKKDVSAYGEKRSYDLMLAQKKKELGIGSDQMTEYQRKRLELDTAKEKHDQFKSYLDENYDARLNDAMARYRMNVNKTDQFGNVNADAKREAIGALKEYRSVRFEKGEEIKKFRGQPTTREIVKNMNRTVSSGRSGFGGYHSTARKADVEGGAQGQNFMNQKSESKRKVVRTGTQDGRKVVQYEDGTIEFAD